MIYSFKDFHIFLNQPVTYSLFPFTDEDFKNKFCYHEVYITKKNGSLRRLLVPSKKLKWLQRRIIPFLRYGNVSSNACAYKRGSDILDNAKPHLHQNIIVKIDIENFFGSISFSQVFHAIDKALELCPNIGKNGNKGYNSELSWYFTKICTLNGVLPQGAPTSPLLSNLVFCSIDNIINSYCTKHHITYTRYSDDMTFSGSFQPSGLIFFIRRLLLENGFKLNEDKLKISCKGTQQLITGIVVNEKIQAPRHYRRKIRQQMYFIGRYGADGYNLNSLLGQINHVLHLDPHNKEFMQYKKECLHLINLFYRL